LPDPQDVEILRSGPRAWNAWRENNPSTVPALTGIALRLSERQMGPINGGPINLKSALLQGAFLRFATLSAADLEAADMSGADLTHARLDRANLSTANLTNARLDYADFSGANLSRVNLCGASLEHAKNLSESQLQESTGNASTILPPHLRDFVPWSAGRGQPEIELHDLRPTAQTADPDVPHGNSHNVPAYALFIGLALLMTMFGVWQRTNEDGGQQWSEPLLTQLRPSITGDHGLQDTAPEGPADRGSTVELSPNVDPAIPPVTFGSSTVVGTERNLGQSSLTEVVPETFQETNVHAVLPASDGARRSIEAAPNEQASKNLEHGDAKNRGSGIPAPIAAEPRGPSQTAVVPDLPAATLKPDPQSHPAAQPSTETLAGSTPEPSASVRENMGPDLPAEAFKPDPHPHAAQHPSEALVVNTPKQHLDSSSPDYTVLPPVTTAPPSVEATELPTNADIPRPVRKPFLQTPVKQSLIQKPGKPGVQKHVKKPAVQSSEVNPKSARGHRAKEDNLAGKKAEQRTSPSLKQCFGLTGCADLLARGL
jgi:hypothetical protein